jgi:hypothetical protein
MALSLIHKLCSSPQHILLLLFVYRLSGNGFTSLLVVICLTAAPELNSTRLHSARSLTRLCRNCSCSSVYSLSMDQKENTSPNSFSIVASLSYCTDRVENTASQLIYCCLLRTCCCNYLATAVVFLLISLSLPSNGSTYHNIYRER